MKTFPTHFEILPAAQRTLWPELHRASTFGFVLYGGTALALRFAHRDSVDFDFFSAEPLDRSMLAHSLPCMSGAQVIQDETDTLTVLVNRNRTNIKVSFFANLGFGRVGEPEFTDDQQLQVASIDDLFGTKLKVLLQRVEAKDYQDIVALLRGGASLARGLAASQGLYGRAFQPAEAMKALTYFEGGDLRRLLAADRIILESAVAKCRPEAPLPILNHRLALDDQ